MADLRGQQLKDSYQNVVTRGAGNKLENGNGVEFADLDDKASLVSSSMVITVGSGGDYESPNSAIKAASRIITEYQKDSLEVEIKFLSGYVLDEQIRIKGQNLGQVVITSEDAVVNVDSTDFDRPDWYTTDGRNVKAVISGSHSVLPTLGCVLNLDVGTDIVGYWATLGSRGRILFDCGCTGFENNIYARDGSTITARKAVATNASSFSLYALHDSTIDARSVDASGSSTGIYVNHASRVDARDSDLSGCGTAVDCRNGIFNAQAANLQNCTSDTAIIREGSIATFRNANLNGSGGTGLFLDGASICDADLASINNASDDAIRMESSCRLSFQDATATGAGNRALACFNGSDASVQDSDLSGAENHGVFASGASKVNALRTDCRINSTSNDPMDIRISNGSIVNANQADGGTSETVNTITSNGIIFG